jgi:predicted N-acyltransferase
VITASAHDIADPSLRRAVQDYLDQERLYISEAADELSEATPFRHRDEDQD